ncbi:MAG TPA: inositol monophosphatase family protein [Solirubrobacterales bacterium]|nr:inositol monophosphatase family protein [Solirubrobacterales bacterium]
MGVDDMTYLLDVAVEAGEAAASILLEKFTDSVLRSSAKSDATDLVSEADRAAETTIRRVIHTHRPMDSLMGEESAEVRGTSDLRWIIDPLDGTENYLRELNPWCTSIACEDDRGTIVGVVVDPMRSEIFTALRGAGVIAPGSRQHAGSSAPNRLEEALVVTGRLSTQSSRSLFDHAGKVRNFGCVALSLAWTAAGRCDICYFENERLSRWDAAAGGLLCTEAGLSVEWLSPLQPGAPPRLVVGPPHLVEALASAGWKGSRA